MIIPALTRKACIPKQAMFLLPVFPQEISCVVFQTTQVTLEHVPCVQPKMARVCIRAFSSVTTDRAFADWRLTSRGDPLITASVCLTRTLTGDFCPALDKSCLDKTWKREQIQFSTPLHNQYPYAGSTSQ
ncbi:hypothetical protein BaRGS_00027503 [Batillaria attramentaria]|uniref:Uncharacterized protein n=1 Tax=Batillaria attramentaria TaxID=370345 RepID=A0ABD0K318_9CAEN